MRGNTYTFFFITLVCIGCALIVAGAASALKSQQEFAERIDTYKNVLLAGGLIERGASISPQEVEKLYQEGIAGILVNVQGEVTSKETNLTPEAVLKQDKVLKGTPGYIEKEKREYPLYTVSKEGKIDAFIVPVYGKGLWSDLFGYLSLEADGKTIRNLVFYKEGETPGLGKEITKPWFQDQFVKKSYLNEANDITFTVGRPSSTPYPNATEVGGISGATITGRGVQKMIVDMMNLYRPYFEKSVWSKG
ncbi:NADH:ubiquinone reductase (Na(+)-transporting) subunit C [bacterium]|nr:NADH:ubiquinone reductase (Na(+)-transporting) subunit C [bacterium]